LQCWICGKDHRKKDCPLHQGGRPHIYSAQEAQKVGDVGHDIPRSYVVVDNMKVDHQASIIDMDGELCHQAISKKCFW